MSALSWPEIRTRASAFSQEWKDEVSEDAEAKSFWDGFFDVFGISRRRVATFEQAVKKTGGQGFIDLLWKGVILIEHKSRGKDLTKAYQQATGYFSGLLESELPKYILVSDFERFRLHDLEEGTIHDFLLKDFVNQVHLFGFIAGYQKKSYKDTHAVNIAAAEKMGKLHDALKDVGYIGHALEVYLVRLLFCLFADDTSIFEKGIFHQYLDEKTREDGADLAMHLDALFGVLNIPGDKRLRNLDDHLAAFPYVNGGLFNERLPQASFDSKMRLMLLDCCSLDWSRISPAIFGSMFQSVMNEKQRRNLGAHYTSERNILKLIRPLFLDELWKEFENVKHDKRKLQQLHQRISTFRLLDPACGCGNFLIIAYRELRLLEIEIVKQLLKGQRVLDISEYFLVNVDQFYGIEIEEFPAQVAQVSMWLTDHQMNMAVGEQFGQYYVRLPLKKSATIVHGNSLQVAWEGLINPSGDSDARYTFIIGNPPFLGKSLQSPEQKQYMDITFAGVNGTGVLDFVAAWYLKAAQYIQKVNATIKNDKEKTKVGFVSTNSIAQGEQVALLWGELFNRYRIKIHFAHRTFSWGNEARNNAAVHVVIIGFSDFDVSEKQLFEYDNIKGEPHVRYVKNINPYLVEGNDSIVGKRRTTISPVPPISFGNMPNDGGGLLLSDEEKNEFLMKEPGALKFIRPLLSAHEFLNGEKRWCLWLVNANPAEINKLPEVMSRIKITKHHREKSTRPATQKLAATPTLFGEIRQPKTNFVLIPLHSSENRRYIPIGFFTPDYIVSNSCSCVPDATLFHFGVLTSIMHMAWVKNLCGRIKSDFRYSNETVYNNFPFPLRISDQQKKAIEMAAQFVLDARDSFPESSLADLYDPHLMPPILVKAHHALDKAVDHCYRSQPFTTEAKRIEFLFELYDQYTNHLFAPEKKKKSKPSSVKE